MPDFYDGVSARDLSQYRLQRAGQLLESAQQLIATGDYNSAANRSYYSIFHAMRAVLALEGVDFKKHSAVISYFRQHYLKTEKLDRELSRIITTAFNVRNRSDYDDFYIISKEAVSQQLADAEVFLAAVRQYIDRP